MGIKYYYSIPQQIRQLTVLTDTGGNILYEFMDSKFIKNLPRVTICSILDGKNLKFGFSTCSSKDVYNKKIGRKIALDRAMKKPYASIDIPDLKDIHIISDKIINDIFESETKRIYHK